MVKKLEERIREQMNLIIEQEIEKAVKQIYETREEQDLAVDNAKLRERVRFLEMSLEEKDENCYSLAKENRELKEDNRVKKINEYDEECVKANTLKRDFSRQRIRELEEDIHMLRVENDMLRKKLRGEY